MKLDGWDRLSIVLCFVWGGFVCYGWIKGTVSFRRYVPDAALGDYFWIYAVIWVIGCVLIWLAVQTVSWVVDGFLSKRED